MKSFAIIALLVVAATAAPRSHIKRTSRRDIVLEQPALRFADPQQPYVPELRNIPLARIANPPLPVAVAKNSLPDGAAIVLLHENDNIGLNNYKYSYSTSNGISQSETGQLQDPGTDFEGYEVIGFYEYPGENGEIIRTDYTAGRNGFQAVGNHIPK